LEPGRHANRADGHDLFDRETVRDNGIRDLFTRKPARIGILNEGQQLGSPVFCRDCSPV
jgi:hypothetical protein